VTVASRAAVIAALRRKVAQRCWTIQTNAHAELTVATPVDTGNARANWQATLDAPAVDVVTVSTGAMEPPGKDFDAARLRFVANNVAYIQRLDAGHSKQAPAGFVRAALAKAVQP
jgi:hypothetical protein